MNLLLTWEISLNEIKCKHGCIYVYLTICITSVARDYLTLSLHANKQFESPMGYVKKQKILALRAKSAA